MKSANIETPAARRPEFSPRTIAAMLWNHRAAIVIMWAVTTGVAVLAILRLPRVYQAEATVLVQGQGIPEKFVTPGAFADLQTRLELLKQRVLSVDVLTRLMSEYNLYEAERRAMTAERVITKFRDDISMRLVQGWSNERPGTFVVAYNGRNAVTVAEVANRIASFFIDGNTSERQALASGTVEFLSRELERAKHEMETEDGRLQSLKVQFNGELPEQEAALTATISQLKAQLAAVQESMNTAIQTRTFIQSALDSARANEALTKNALMAQQHEIAVLQNERKWTSVAPATPPAPTDVDRIRKELQDARTRYSDDYPEVRRLLAALERAKANEAHAAPSQQGIHTATDRSGADAGEVLSASALPVIAEIQQRTGNLVAQLAGVEKQIQDLESERQRLGDELAPLQAKILRIPLHSQQITAAGREAEVARSNYLSLLDKKLEASVTANMETRRRGERFELLDPARVPQEPIRPRRKLLSAAGSLAAFVFSCLAVCGMEWRRGRMMGEWELPEGVPVLGRIPLLPES